MKAWLLGVVLRPLFILAYVALIAGLLWLAQRLPPGRLRRIATYEFSETKTTGILLLIAGAAMLLVPLTVAWWRGLY